MDGPSSQEHEQNGDGDDDTILYDAVGSYYAQIAQMALEENSVPYASQRINIFKAENMEPWYMKMHPDGQVPAARSPDGTPLAGSRAILDWAYQSQPETDDEKEVIDLLYSECPGSLAFLTGARKIPLLKFVVNVVRPLAIRFILPRKIRRYQSENPDMYDVYENKRGLLANKHFTKSIRVVQSKIQGTVDYLEEKRRKSPGQWILGPDFGRVDAISTVFLQWVTRCNEYGVAPICLPGGLQEYLGKARLRPSFKTTIGQYGEKAFVLNAIEERNRATGKKLAKFALLTSALLGGFISYRYQAS